MAQAWLSAVEASHVRWTFAQLGFSGDRFVIVFYERLFEVAPAARAMFPASLDAQYAKLMDMLGVLVNALDDPATLAEALAATGRRHAGYGALPEHYPVVEQVFLCALGEVLGPELDPHAAAAWRALLRRVSHAMCKAAATASQAAACVE